MALPANHPYLRDPLRGLAVYAGLRRFFLASLAGALVALAAALLLFPLSARWPWLGRSLAEALVFAGSIAVLMAVMALLAWIYMGRPLAALARERGLPAGPASPPPARPSVLRQAALLAGAAALAVLLLGLEYRYRDLLADPDFARRGLSRLMNPYGYPIPSGAGIALTAFGLILANAAANWIAWIGRRPR